MRIYTREGDMKYNDWYAQFLDLKLLHLNRIDECIDVGALYGEYYVSLVLEFDYKITAAAIVARQMT